jgi:septum formation protein
MITLPDLVLASGSPRRAEILNSVGWNFISCVPDIDESEREGETPEDYVQRLAREKARVVQETYPDAFILAADTTVVVDGRILGKPDDLEHARKMLRILSGRWHDVLTGVAVSWGRQTFVAFEKTGVKFEEMNEAEIEFLARMGDPLDKAGAYAVQAQAALFIERIDGDYWNVVGLPVGRVYQIMKFLWGR